MRPVALSALMQPYTTTTTTTTTTTARTTSKRARERATPMHLAKLNYYQRKQCYLPEINFRIKLVHRSGCFYFP